MAYFRCIGQGQQSSPLLFDSSDLIADKYIDSTNGEELPYVGWSCTNYIDISDYELLIGHYNYNSNLYNAFYDDNYDFISNISFLSGDVYNIITIPSTAKYARFSMDSTKTLVVNGIYSLEPYS